MARRSSTLVSIFVSALLASSAAAMTTESTTPIPSKRELQRAGASFAAKPRTGLGSSAVFRLAPALGRRAAVTVGAKASRRSVVALTAVETALLGQVNAVRRGRGLRALTISRGLSAAAAYHSRQMIQHGFFEHESRGGGPFWKRVERFYASSGFRAWEVGENLAYGSPDLTVAATVRMWMNSPGHRENLLSRRWREIGLGVLHVEAAGGEFGGGPVTVVTADFGYRVR